MASGSGGNSRGPVGANGSRPLLGRAGAGAGGGVTGGAAQQAAKPPSYRVPGASVAANAAAANAARVGPVRAGGTYADVATEAGGARSSGTGGDSDAVAATANTGPETRQVGTRRNDDDCDADGFRPVQTRGWRRGRAGTAATQQSDQGAGATGDGGCCGGDERDGDGGADAADGEDDGQVQPTANDLHRAWQAEVAVVRQLKQQGIAHEHPAMRAACAARDAAEGAWRGAKDPAPAAVRLARAQAKLDRALELLAETRNALAEYERAHEAKLAALQARMDEDRARVKGRRQQLEAIQAEVGAEGMGARARAQQGRQGAAVKEVHSAICGTVAPTIAALVEQVDSATPAWSMLNGLLSTLSSSKALLEEAISAAPAAQRFDLTDDADHDDSGDADGMDEEGGSWEGSQWSESHEVPADSAGGTASAPCTNAERAAASLPQGSQGGGHRDGHDGWWSSGYGGSGWGTGTRWEACGHGKYSRTNWADSWEMELEQPSGDEGQPAAARRRLEPRATEEASGESGNGTDGGGGAADADAQRKQHEARVDRIMQAAIDAGVQPITNGGEDLRTLDPHQLNAWVAEHLQNAAGW